MKAFFLIITVIFLYCSCENMMQEIDVEPANLLPMLAVTATLDTEKGGTLYIHVTEGRSIGSYKDGRPDNETIVRQGNITLFENNKVICSMKNATFDLSRSEFGSGFTEELNFLGSFKAGNTYRLELDIEGYPLAKASVIMPEAPVIENWTIDRQRVVIKKKPYEVPSIGHGGGGSNYEQLFFPVTIRLMDNSADRDYYAIKLHNTNSGDGYIDTYIMPIGVSNRALVQDNPDMEADGLFLDTESDVFLFRQLLLSDMSFSNATGTLDLLILQSSIPDKEWPECDNPEQILRTEISISHLSTAAYNYYRSLTLQYQGVGFFTEPVSITSNFTNAYGCFSVCNTTRITLSEYLLCKFYEDWSTK